MVFLSRSFIYWFYSRSFMRASFKNWLLNLYWNIWFSFHRFLIANQYCIYWHENLPQYWGVDILSILHQYWQILNQFKANKNQYCSKKWVSFEIFTILHQYWFFGFTLVQYFFPYCTYIGFKLVQYSFQYCTCIGFTLEMFSLKRHYWFY